jgi:hypothetical protein
MGESELSADEERTRAEKSTISSTMGESGLSTDEERARVQKNLEKFSKINEMYYSGVPFFTKETMRDIHQQLLNAKTGDKISVLNLDGTKREFTYTVGKVYDDHDDPETTESIVYAQSFILVSDQMLTQSSTEAYIDYQSIQDYTPTHDGCYNMSFCPMPIGIRHERRNIVTKEPRGWSMKPLPDLPLEEAEKLFKTSLEEWESSEQCKQFRSIITSANCHEGITKIVAFACGRFSSVTPDSRYSRANARSGAQHALIFTLRDILSNMWVGDRKTIKCYAQDPAYTATDKSLLEQAGVTILNDPEAFLEVDESTVVLSVSPSVCVRQIVADIARPAIMIWDPIKWDENEMEAKLV